MKEKIKNNKGFIQIPLLVAIIAFVIVATGAGYGGFEYYKTSKIINEAEQLSKEEKYDEAIEKLKSIQNRWLTRNLGIKRQEINKEIEKNKEFIEDKSEYAQGIEEFNKGNWGKAKELLSKVSELSPYYQEAKNKTEEAQNKITEEQIAEAVEKATEKTKQEMEETKRKVEEARKESEEARRKAREVQREAEEESKKKITELEKKIEELEQQSQQQSGIDEEWQAYIITGAVARIVCYEFPYFEDISLLASGSIWWNNNNYWILTNDHVLEEPYNHYDYCVAVAIKDWVAATEDFDNAIQEGEVLIYEVDLNEYFYDPTPGSDLAVALLKEIPDFNQPLFLLDEVTVIPNIQECNETYEISTSIKIIGFPSIGPIIPTITEGIIASFEKVEEVYYYLTSAKIEEGNSGGLAVTDDFYCVLGIPTVVMAGELESLGRVLVLTEEYIFDFLSSINP